MQGKSSLMRLLMPVMILLLVLTAYQYGYKAIQEEIEAVRDTESVKIKTLQRYVDLISEKPALEAELEALKERKKAAESKLIEGQTASLASATLQDVVKGIILGRGGSITSERVGKPEELDGFSAVNISKDAVVPDARSLSDILYMIETQTPQMRIKELDVRVRDYRTPKELMIKLDVSALTKGR